MSDPEQVANTVDAPVGPMVALAREVNEINRANGWNVLNPQEWAAQEGEALAGWNFDKPHYIAPHEGCMGEMLNGFWRVFAQRGDNKVIGGCGATPDAAIAAATQNILSDPVLAYKIPAVLALITSEVSEALEAFRKRDRENFDEEIADVVIRCLDLCGGLGIDIDEQVRLKLEKNKTRGLRHGGKRI